MLKLFILNVLRKLILNFTKYSENVKIHGHYFCCYRKITYVKFSPEFHCKPNGTEQHQIESNMFPIWNAWILGWWFFSHTHILVYFVRWLQFGVPFSLCKHMVLYCHRLVKFFSFFYNMISIAQFIALGKKKNKFVQMPSITKPSNKICICS